MFKKITDTAILPAKAHPADAGYDLTSIQICNGTVVDGVIKLQSGQVYLAKTGLSVAIPRGYVGRILPRSGLAVKHGIDVLAGVIDSGYDGELVVVFHTILKSTDLPVTVLNNCELVRVKIAQLVVEKIHDEAEPAVVTGATITNCAPGTVTAEPSRGAAGFGSTGI